MIRWTRPLSLLSVAASLFMVPLDAQVGREDPCETRHASPDSSETGKDLLDYKSALRFARYLNNTGQYRFATQEYERLNYFNPGDSAVMLELVRTYRLDGNCDMLGWSHDLYSRTGRLRQPHFTREYLNYCLRCGTSHPSYRDLSASLDPPDRAFYLLSYYWRTEQYDSAFYLNRHHTSVLKNSYPQLHLHTAEFEKQSYKSPFLALLMSVVIPGSGKAYSGRWGDAAVSFLFVSTAAYASYRAFNKKGIRSFNGWLMGGVAFSFYSSNLYGSFKSAVNYNRNVVTRYQDEAKRIIYSHF